MQSRVVITGMGAVTSLGIGAEHFWQAIKAGKSGITPVERIPVADLPTRIGAEIKEFDTSSFIDKKESKRMDRFAQYAVAATGLAFAHSGLDTAAIDRWRAGVIIGTGIGGVETIENQHTVLLDRGPDRISPFFVPMMLPNMAAGLIGIKYKLTGVAEWTVSAWASCANAIGDAY